MFLKKAGSCVSKALISENGTLELAGKMLGKNFPEGAKVIEKAAFGTYHAVYLCTARRGEFYLKIGLADSTIGSLGVEQFIYTRILPQIDLKLEVLGAGRGGPSGNIPYLILKSAEGTCMRSIDFKDPFYGRYIHDLGQVLARLHSLTLDLSGYGLVDAGHFLDQREFRGLAPNWSHYILDQLDDHLAVVRSMKLLEATEEIFIREALMSFLESTGDPPQRLLHGDLGSHNVYVDMKLKRVSAIIDWEDVLIGDPIFDIAMGASFHRMTEFLDKLLSGYGQESLLLDQDTSFRFWLYFIRIALAKAVIRCRFYNAKEKDPESLDKINLALAELRKIM